MKESDRSIDTKEEDVLGYARDGGSPWYTKQMALKAKEFAVGSQALGVSADIGAGRGELTNMLANFSDRVVMVDFYPPSTPLSERKKFIQADLNSDWPLEESSIDFAFAIEVIEHLENPRHFVRELKRVLKPGGFGFMSTPNNHSWASKLTFL